MKSLDFDIGTLIYILITIVALVASVLGKKKKPATKPSAEGKSKSFFERLEEQIGSLVEDAAGKKTIFSSEPVPEEIVAENPSERTFQQEISDYNEILRSNEAYTRDNLREEIHAESGFYSEEDLEDQEYEEESEMEEIVDLISNESIRTTDGEVKIEVIDNEIASMPDYSEIIEEFDLAHAVIYSSIINRIEY